MLGVKITYCLKYVVTFIIFLIEDKNHNILKLKKRKVLFNFKKKIKTFVCV